MNPEINRQDLAEAWTELAASGAPVDVLPTLIVTPKHTHTAKFNVGSVVLHKGDASVGVVLAIVLRPSGVRYSVAWESSHVPQIAEHHEAELTSKREP